MSLPTLLLKGNLEKTEWNESQEQLDQFVPLNYIMNWFDKRIPNSDNSPPKIKATSPADRIMILKSSTGSGKSTTLPPRLYHLFQKRTGNRNLFISQPRVLTALDLPKNTIPPFNTKEFLTKTGHPEFEPLIFGRNIGVQTGVIRKKPVKASVLCTTGIIVQQISIMSTNQFLQKYSFIVVR